MDDNNKMAASGNVIGQRLKAEMKKRGVSSAELAVQSQVKTSFIYDIISGKSANPSTVKLARVANCLGISLAYLADANEKPRAGVFGDYVHVYRLIVDANTRQACVVSAAFESEPCLFRKSWITEGLRVNHEHLRVLLMVGDSMQPTLHHNDLLLIDTAQQLPTPPGIFVIFDGFGLAVKRLERVHSGPSVRIISDNAYYSSYERLLADASIIGRVIWFARSM